MERRQRPLRATECARDLDEAAGVRARVRLRPRREDVARLAVAELAGSLGLDEVVDPSRTAAEVLLVRLDDLEAGDAGERRASRERQLLGVAEVARVLERDLHAERMTRRTRWRLREQFTDVAHLRSERLRALVAEKPAEFLQVRPAARRVDDDEVDVFEGGDEAMRERLALVEPARMHGERTTAALRRRDDLEAVGCEDAGCRRVHVGEDRALHAAGEEADPRVPGSDGRGQCGDLAVPTPARGNLDERPQPLRHRRGPADRRQPKHGAHSVGVGEETEEEPAHEPVSRRSLELLLDRRSRALDQPVVAHAGRTRRDAGHAAQAAVEVLRDRRVERDRAVEARVHQVDPTTRRVHLLVPQHVRRAGRQAEPAVDAVRRVLADHGPRTPCGSSSRRSLPTSKAAPSSPRGPVSPGSARATYATPDATLTTASSRPSSAAASSPGANRARARAAAWRRRDSSQMAASASSPPTSALALAS